MTHFIGAVLVPADVTIDFLRTPTEYPDLYGKDKLDTEPTQALNEYLGEALAKFDENVVVERWVSKEDTIAAARKKIQEYAEGTYAEYLADPEAYSKGVSNLQHLDYLANEFPKKLAWTDEEVYADEIRYEEDEDVREDGAIRHTYNPNSKWDWWTIGGRWEKIYRDRQGEKVSDVLEQARQSLADITDPENVAELSAYQEHLKSLYEKRNEQSERTREWCAANPDKMAKSWQENWRLANPGVDIVDHDAIDAARAKLRDFSAYLPWWFPFHLVVPTQIEHVNEAGEAVYAENGEPEMVRDFEWKQQGEMGWFGMKSDEMDNTTWVRQFIELLENSDPQAKLVYIDFHI